MKIAQYSDMFFPQTGGLQTHIQSIYEYYKDIQFDIVTNGINNYQSFEVISKNARIRRFGPNNIVCKRGNKILFPQRFFSSNNRYKKKIGWLNKSKVDLVHVHGPTLGMELLKADRFFNRNLFSKKMNFRNLNKPKLLTMHGLLSPYSGNRIDREFEKQLIKSFNRIICVDESIYRYVKSVNGSDKNLHFIPNSIDIEAFRIFPRSSHKKIRLAYIGRPDSLRGFEIIRKFAQQVPNGFELHLIIATDSIQPLGINSSKNVNIIYNLNQSHLIKELKDIDLVINPLKIPVISRVTLEAMACGKPTITTQKGNIYPIRDKETGFVFKNGMNGLINLLKEIKSGRYNLENMALNGREIIEKEFSNEKVMPKIRKIYEKVSKSN